MRRAALGSFFVATMAAIATSTLTGTVAVTTVPMDAVGLDLQGASTPNATPAVTRRAVAGKGEGFPRLGSATAADEISAGRPAEISAVRRGHTKAGATAERLGEPAPVGSGFRRHRAPSARLHRIVVSAAAERGVPIHILAGLAEDESTWREKARGKHGERGLFQLKAATATWCGGKVDRLDAFDNADCAARYLYAQFERFGSWELALAAYKAGPSRVPEDIPAESWAFVQRTLERAEAYR